jgi:importin subunit alpha-1
MFNGDEDKDDKRRQRNFKKGIDADDARRQRSEVSVELRKSKREEQIQKRRQAAIGTAVSDADYGAADAGGNAAGADMQNRLNEIPGLVQAVRSDDGQAQLNAVREFRKLLSIERKPPIQEVIDSGIVPLIVEFLTYAHLPALQFEAAWTLTNIASGTTEHTSVVIRHGAIPLFVEQLKSQAEEVREQATWALGNIAGDSYQCRDLVLEAGALPLLLNLCTPDAKLTMLRNATWTLSNCCRGKPNPEFAKVAPALRILAQLIHCKDDEVLTDACWALSYLSDDTGQGEFL